MIATPSRHSLHIASSATTAPFTCRGVTLIEVLIVMTIIVVLAGIAMAVHTTALTRSKEAVLREDLRIMRDAIDQYYADKEQYPPTLDTLVGDDAEIDIF